ncbi:hypothetical protein NDU88_007782 [Pleurodeles waltl]|uniref:Uncharacterized protein n=1 Tax=Pleurodeles waltl TaxID=8319 RepID=A0AAV7RQF4_PLEWA|nr:hypothetical protein NDU88_007782 [Pleurodeles waltl]
MTLSVSTREAAPGESAAAACLTTLGARNEVGAGQERGEGRAEFPYGRAAVGDARLASGVGLGSVFSPFTKLLFCVPCARSSTRLRSGPHIFLMWEGEQSPTAGRSTCSRPRRALILVPPRAVDRVQPSPSPTEALAENEWHLDQVSARGGPGTLALLLYGVNRCSGPQSAERGPIPPAARAPGAQAECGQAKGRRALESRSGSRHTAPPGVDGCWSPNAVWWGAADFGRLPPRQGLSLHGAGASATPRSALHSWAAAGSTRPAVGYVGLPLDARGEPP